MKILSFYVKDRQKEYFSVGDDRSMMESETLLCFLVLKLGSNNYMFLLS